MQIFDQEWVEAASQLLADLPVVEGASALVCIGISGMGKGIRYLTANIKDGRFESIEFAKAREAQISVSFDYPFAVEVFSGKTNCDEGYMSGDVKVEGDYAYWLLDLREVRGNARRALAQLMPQLN